MKATRPSRTIITILFLALILHPLPTLQAQPPTERTLTYRVTGAAYYWNSQATVEYRATETLRITPQGNDTELIYQTVSGVVSWPQAVFYQTHYTDGDKSVRIVYGNETAWEVRNTYRIRNGLVEDAASSDLTRVEFYPIYAWGWQSNAWESILWPGGRNWLRIKPGLEKGPIQVQTWVEKYQTKSLNATLLGQSPVRVADRYFNATFGRVTLSYLFPGRIEEPWTVTCNFYWDNTTGYLVKWERVGETYSGSWHRFTYELVKIL